MKYYFVIIFAALFFNASLTYANPQFAWLTPANSKTQKVAQTFLEQSSLPEDTSRVLYHIDIKIDGKRVTKRVQKAWFVATQVDTDEYGNDIIYWDKEVEKLTIREAGVVTHDGQYQRFKPDNLRVLDSDSYNIFTDQKKVVIAHSGVREKSVSVLDYEVTYDLHDLESNWSYSHYPAWFSDTLDYSFKISSNSIKLNWASNEDRVQCDFADNSLHCTGRDLNAYKDDKGVVWRNFLNQVSVSQSNNWDEVIDKSIIAFEKANLTSPTVDKVLAELVKKEDSTEQKIARIHEFIARDIRYISMSELGHRITPHTFDSIIENRFGDCKDKSASLVGLLRRIGLNAYPVLVATKRSDPSRLQVPSGSYFDHMIVCFELDGETYCIDATDTNTHWRATSSWIQGKVILPLLKGEVPRRLDSRGQRWQMEVKTHLLFDRDAAQIEKQIRRYKKSYAGDYRSSLRGKKSSELNEWAMEQYHSNVSDSVEPEFEFGNIDALERDLFIHSYAQYEPFMEPTDALNYTEKDYWLRYELNNSSLSAQHYDAEFSGLDVLSIYEFDVTPLWTVLRKPAHLLLDGKYGLLKRTTSLSNDGILTVSTRLSIPRQTIAADEIDAFNEFLELLNSQTSMSVYGKLKP